MHTPLQLFAHVKHAYLHTEAPHLTNAELYTQVAQRAGLTQTQLQHTRPIGRHQTPRSPITRAIRWSQQTLKHLNLITRVPGHRGIWTLTESLRADLHRAQTHVKLLAFSTNLGLAIWGSHHTVFRDLRTPITLCLTSPPYPLRNPRAYGNPTADTYVEFICDALAPIITNLVPGGSICLNLSNDIFLPGLPARSLYRERTILALCERFHLFKMDEIPWVNPSKPPGPVQWTSKQRVQLNVGWEAIYWLCNQPSSTIANNRRVLLPHTAQHQRLIQQGGEQQARTSGDGAYRIRPGSFRQATAGRIPRNVLTVPHTCADSNQYRRDARRLGLPIHGAIQPFAIPKFLIEFLSEPDDLIVDPFGGTCSTAKAAETLQRRWITTEYMLEYIRAAAERFRPDPGFWLHPSVAHVQYPPPRRSTHSSTSHAQD